MIRYAPFWLKLETYNFFLNPFLHYQEKCKRIIIRKTNIQETKVFLKVYGTNFFPLD